MMSTPPITVGNCISLCSASSSGFTGMSEAPKSTVRLLIWLMPAPEPIAW